MGNSMARLLVYSRKVLSTHIFQLAALISWCNSSLWIFVVTELCLRLRLLRQSTLLIAAIIFAFLHFFLYNKKKLIYFICMRVINPNDLCSLQIYWQFHIKIKKKRERKNVQRQQSSNNQRHCPGWRVTGSRPVCCSFCLHFTVFIYRYMDSLLSATTAAKAAHRILEPKTKSEKASKLWSPKAALQLKCIFPVYELNLINNFCIVAKSFLFVAISDCQQTV